MKSTTRRAEPGDLTELLRHPPRAYLAFDDQDGITAAPVRLHFADGRYFIAIRGGVAEGWPRVGQPAMLLVDDGQYSLELRGLRIRGQLTPLDEPPPADPDGARWWELVPQKVIAWDYSRLRRRESA